METLNHARMNPLFTATVEATHEAIVNALCMATTTRGIRGRVAHALPLESPGADILQVQTLQDA